MFGSIFEIGSVCGSVTVSQYSLRQRFSRSVDAVDKVLMSIRAWENDRGKEYRDV